jgi:hypothetical protein
MTPATAQTAEFFGVANLAKFIAGMVMTERNNHYIAATVLGRLECGN